MNARTSGPWGMMVVMGMAVVAAAGAGFDLTWRTVDGGGGLRSTGGGFELSGTIGQPDAGELSGNGFTMNGGFWLRIAPGDCTEDGAVTLFDHAHYSQCANGPTASPLAEDCTCMDIDLDGDVDLFDFAALQVDFSAP